MALKRPPIRVLDLAGSPQAMGYTHGRAYADEIRTYAADRIDLVASGGWSGGPIARSEIIDLAESMLPCHERFHPGLFGELIGIAEGAGLSPAETVIVGGFTDFVDTVRATIGGPLPQTVIEDDCTAVLVPDHRAGGSGFLAQTWDMHATATDHVLVLRLAPVDGPKALVFTTTGCLGQIGMNEAGVAVGINNLVGIDGAPAVTWTTVVRAMLETTSAPEALDVLQRADLAGAHNYLILDSDGVGFNVEAMPSAQNTETLNDAPLVHTNHATAANTRAVEAPKPPEMRASSNARYRRAQELVAEGDIDPQSLMGLTRDDQAICQRSNEPFHVETSGAAIMRPGTGDFWACWGLPSVNDFEHLTVGVDPATGPKRGG